MNKHQQHPVHSVDPSPLLDSIAEHPIVQWISHNGRALLWVLLGGTLLALLAYRLLGGSSQVTGEVYFQAENQYQAFQKGTDAKAQKEALDKLTAIINKHSDLQSKYDGLIAQVLLDRGQVQQAQPFAERSLARTDANHLDLYNDYATTTLLMANQKYSEALKATEELKQKLIQTVLNKEEKQNFGYVLYAYNALRLAMIQQALGNKAEELKAWQEFKQLAATGQNNTLAANPQAFDQLFKQLGEGNVTLLNYIESREHALKQ